MLFLQQSVLCSFALPARISTTTVTSVNYLAKHFGFDATKFARQLSCPVLPHLPCKTDVDSSQFTADRISFVGETELEITVVTDLKCPSVKLTFRNLASYI